MTCHDASRAGAALPAEIFDSLRPAIADAFDRLLADCRAARQVPAADARRMAGPLSRLLALTQAADAIDQRLAHLAEIDRRLDALSPEEGWGALRIAGRHVMAIADTLGDAGATAIREARALEGAGAGRAPAEAGEALIALGAHLAAVGSAIGAAAAAGSEPTAGGGAAFAWMQVLYTMDAEREVHARALCG